MGETTAVAHGAWVCVRNLRPHRCLPRGTAVAHGGDPQDRNGAFSVMASNPLTVGHAGRVRHHGSHLF
ncbi:MAG: hypothetical protein F6K56_01495 [Moorea sp. SIO3G5]|nr:hypothetical protein [Moorena sp. SIO3G5]